MSSTKQDLLSLKEENLKLNENFKKFWKKHKLNKKYISKDKIKELMKEQEMLINNVNLQIDNIIVKNEKRYEKIVRMLPQKRKMSEILPNFENEYKSPKRPHMELEIVKNSFENVINNPGLQHLAENIFSFLSYDDLKSCQLINRSSKSILANSRFWLQKLVHQGMSKKNQNDWIKAIQLTKDTDFERNLLLYLKRSFCKGKIIDIPCCIDENTIQKSSELMKKYFIFPDIILYYVESYVYNDVEFEGLPPGCFQALAALESYSLRSYFLMRLLAQHGNLEMMKVVSPLLDNPNLQDPDSHRICNNHENKFTPFSTASEYGQLKILKFLEPFTDINAIQVAIRKARIYNQNHIIKYLYAILESKQ